MIGDSITDCGRAQPVGEGLFGALGNGYVSMVEALLLSTYPELGIRVVNMGTSGNTVRDLANRWQSDVIDQKPDWLTIMIGTNDVWRQFDCPFQKELHVSPEEYRATLSRLVGQAKPMVKGLVLATPFYLEPNQTDQMRHRMDEYGAVVQDLAVKHGCIFVDMQAAFETVLSHYHSATFAWDRVHPTQAGHAVLAKAFLEAFGFNFHGK